MSMRGGGPSTTGLTINGDFLLTKERITKRGFDVFY